MTDFSRNALVVEGGGMRGAFTSGVLDAFLQQQFNPLTYTLVYLLVRPMWLTTWQVSKVGL